MPQIYPSEIFIKGIPFGKNHPPVIQTMLTSHLNDYERVINETQSLLNLGCRVIRVAISRVSDLKDFAKIQKRLPEEIVWIADVHFQPELAFAALDIFDKVRINGGNFGLGKYALSSEKPEDINALRAHIESESLKFFEKAKRLDRAVRIGMNEGSLAPYITAQYGHSSSAFWENALQFLKIAEHVGFKKIFFSFKSTSALSTIEINRAIMEKLRLHGCIYPFHVGITEAGFGEAARVKSALGIGVLAKTNNISTFRVSLSESTTSEILFAKILLDWIQKHPFPDFHWEAKSVALHIENPSSLTPNSLNFSELQEFNNHKEPPYGEKDIHMMLQTMDKILSQKNLTEIYVGKHQTRLQTWIENILQALNWQRFGAEIISCPTCGRTQYNVSAIAQEIKEKLGHYKGIKIAVMGCVINGIGEMGNADYGYIGNGKGKVNLYKKGKCVYSRISESEAVATLKSLIESDLLQQKIAK